MLSRDDGRWVSQTWGTDVCGALGNSQRSWRTVTTTVVSNIVTMVVYQRQLVITLPAAVAREKCRARALSLAPAVASRTRRAYHISSWAHDMVNTDITLKK